jgi:transcriptional regulator with XRE-family HTH domain
MPERSFGRVVRYRRTKLGLSQAQLGHLVGRSPATVRSWEADKSVPNDPKLISTLSTILGVDERTLFLKAGQEAPPPLELPVEEEPTVEDALASLTSGTEAVTVSSKIYEELEPEEVPESRRVTLMPGPAEEVDEPDDPGPGILIDLDSSRTPSPKPSVSAPPTSSTPPPSGLVITTPAYPVVEASYLEDSGQRQLYRVRTLATIVGLVALVVALLWAAGEGVSALGEWWDGFIGTLRL